jgi:hypothetical protein
MKSIIIIVLSVLISGCDSSSKLIFNELPNEGWPQDHWEAFTHKNYLLNDEVSLSWILRHDNEYPDANIFYIAELTTPKGETPQTQSYLNYNYYAFHHDGFIAFK